MVQGTLKASLLTSKGAIVIAFQLWLKENKMASELISLPNYPIYLKLLGDEIVSCLFSAETVKRGVENWGT